MELSHTNWRNFKREIEKRETKMLMKWHLWLNYSEASIILILTNENKSEFSKLQNYIKTTRLMHVSGQPVKRVRTWCSWSLLHPQYKPGPHMCPQASVFVQMPSNRFSSNRMTAGTLRKCLYNSRYFYFWIWYSRNTIYLSGMARHFRYDRGAKNQD